MSGIIKIKFYKIFVAAVLINILFFFASCGEIQKWFYPNVDTAVPVDNGKFSDFFKTQKKVIITELKMPTNVRASLAEYGDQIVIAWKDSSDADYYIVYRKKTDDSVFEERATVLQGVQTYTDVFVVEDLLLPDLYVDYEYRVEAHTNNGIIGPPSSNVIGYLLTPPRSGTGSKSSTKITIRWNEVRGAVRYRVYRSKDTNSFGSLLSNQVSKNLRSFVDTAELDYGVQYFYYIVSLSSSGQSLVPAHKHPKILGVRIRPDAPLPPSVEATKAKFIDRIEVSWNVVNPNLGGEVVYNIYKNNIQSSFLATLATELTQGELVLRNNKLVFVDKDADGLGINEQYVYYVQPVEEKSGKKLQGGYSADPDLSQDVEDQDQTGYILSPPNPKSIRAKRENGNIKITWTKALGAIRYEIYTSNSASSTFAALGVVDGSGDNLFEYIHVGNTIQGSVFYKIKSIGINLIGDEFETILLSSQPVETLPGKVINVRVSDNVYHAAAREYNNNNVYPIKIEWDSAQNTGGKTYSVWRALSNGTSSPPEEEKYVQIITGISDLYFYDDADFMRVRQYIYYKVRAHNSLGGFGDMSDADRGYGALRNVQYVEEFQQLVLAALRTLTYANRSGTDAIGTETIAGAISGTVHYTASGGLSGGTGDLTFTNYAHKTDSEDSSKPYLLVTGSSHTTADTSSNGNQTANYTTSGMYGGSIKATLKITSGTAGDGTYLVTQSSGVPSGNVAALDVTQP